MEVVRTETEKKYIAQYENRIDGDPEWLKPIREAAIEQFKVLGLPHRRVEEWKYTDLKSKLRDVYITKAPKDGVDVSSLTVEAVEQALGQDLAQLDQLRLVFVDGQFVPELSVPENKSAGLEILPLNEAITMRPDWMADFGLVADQQSDAVQALNMALMQDGIAINVPDGTKLAPVLHLLFLATGREQKAATCRHFLNFGDEAKATLLESHIHLGSESQQSNMVLELIAGRNAEIDHVKLTEENSDSIHLANLIGAVGAGSTYNHFQLTLNGGISRHQITLRFDGEHAKSNISGAALLASQAHSDMTLVVDHKVPLCESRELFKTVLDDQSRAVFQGKVIVRPDAQKTDGEMMSNALLLSEQAEFDSKPELEIYADDVVCGHGATSGQIDEELLFYLKARGLPDKLARQLLIQAFIGEALELIEDDTIRAAFIKRADLWHEGHDASKLVAE